VRIEQERVRDILQRAVADFERNGFSRSVIHQCEHEAPEAFLREGLRVLLDADGTPGYRVLALLLARMADVFQELTDRWKFNRDEAIAVAKRLHRVDPNFDTRMAGPLTDRDRASGRFRLDGEHAERALEILDEISPGRRITPTLRRLTEHPDQRVSSKAALLIGRRLQNLPWARRVITEGTDSRLRANALEAFWGMNSPAVIELFRECLQDWDNRVVGNAIIGLHKAGDPEIFELVSKIAAESKPEFRMTAAWTMGRIGDPTLVSVLVPLAKDCHADVRRAALRSLRRYHGAEKQLA
jgi:hypothetical protein